MGGASVTLAEQFLGPDTSEMFEAILDRLQTQRIFTIIQDETYKLQGINRDIREHRKAEKDYFLGVIPRMRVYEPTP